MDFRLIPVKSIVVKENSRCRLKTSDVAELMTSMKRKGLEQPIKVEEKKKGKKTVYELIFGNRRYNAALNLEWETIPARVVADYTEDEALLDNLTENLQREDVPIYDNGRIMNRLKEEFSMSDTEIAAKLGVSLMKVKAALDIFRHTPEKFRQKIKSVKGGPKAKKGNIPTHAARKIVMLKKYHPDLSKKNVDQLFEYAKQDDFSYDKLKIISNKLDEGLSFKDSLNEGKSLHTTKISIVMSEKDHKYVLRECKKQGITLHEALTSRVYGEDLIRALKRVN